MTQSNSQAPDLISLQEDIAALKHDLGSLIGHLRDGAANGAQNALGQIDSGSRGVYRNVAAEGDRAVKAIGQQIEKQPLMALLLVLGVGFLGGRLLSR